MKKTIYSLICMLLVSGLAVYSMSSPNAPREDSDLADIGDSLAVVDSAATTADALSVMAAGSVVGAPFGVLQSSDTVYGPAVARAMVWQFNHSVFIP